RCRLVCPGRAETKRTAPAVRRGRLRFTPHLQNSRGLAASARPERAPPKIQCQCSYAVPLEPVENSDNSELRSTLMLDAIVFASNVGLIISRRTPSADCPLMVSRIRRTLEASTSSVGASFFLDENVFWFLRRERLLAAWPYSPRSAAPHLC